MAQDWALSDIRDAAKRFSGLRSTLQVTDAQWARLINLVYRNEMPQQINGKDLEKFYEFSTVDGEGTHDLALNVVELLDGATLDDNDGDQEVPIIFWRDQAAFFKHFPHDDTPDKNEPQGILLWGNDNDTDDDKFRKIYIRPVPDAVYTIRIPAVIKPEKLDADTEVPVWENWGSALAYAAARNALALYGGHPTGKMAEMQTWFEYYFTLVNRNHLQQQSSMAGGRRF